eukprot:765269-Hanusia_phi.AAC.3
MSLSPKSTVVCQRASVILHAPSAPPAPPLPPASPATPVPQFSPPALPAYLDGKRREEDREDESIIQHRNPHVREVVWYVQPFRVSTDIQ